MHLDPNLQRVATTLGCALLLSAASSRPQQKAPEPTTGVGWLEKLQRDRLLLEQQWAAEARDRKTADAIDVILKDPLKWQQARADLLATRSSPKSLKQLALPTKYEDPIAYAELQAAASVIQAGNVSKFFDVHPLYGTSTGGTFHASTTLVCPSSDYVILFHRQLFSLTDFFSTLFLAAEGRPIVLRPDLIALVQNGLLAYLVDGDVADAQVPRLTAKAEAQANFLRTVITGFVVSHEYGHIVGKHFPACGAQDRAAVGRDLRFDQAQEYSADATAFVQMMEWAKEKQLDPVDVFLAVDWQFAFNELLDRAGSVMTTGSEEAVPNSPWSDSSHPYTRFRREFLLTLASKLLPGDEERLNTARQMANSLRFEMWQASRFRVLDEWNKKKNISPSVRR